MSNMQSKEKLVVTRNLGPDAMAILQSEQDIDLVVWQEDRACDRGWLLRNARGASALLIMVSDKIDVELLNAAGSSLRAISTMSVGYEHIDLRELQRRGIALGYTPDVLTEAVADVCIMLALMAGRNAAHTTRLVREGKWPYFSWAPFLFCGPQLSAPDPSHQRTAGFIGFGRIAKATLARLVPFGFTHAIYYSNPTPSRPGLPKSALTSSAISIASSNSSNSTNSSLNLKGSVMTGSASHDVHDRALARKLGLWSIERASALDDVARKADVVFVLAPGGQATYHIVDEAFLRRMKRTAILVNASRGTLVDSDALAKVLGEGVIYAAGLDVVEGEPHIPHNHPLVKEPRCVILPHIGSATNETRTDMASLAARNAISGVFGEQMPSFLPL